MSSVARNKWNHALSRKAAASKNVGVNAAAAASKCQPSDIDEN